MNDIMNVIKNRRSCRSYKPELIKDSELDVILEAGEWAASGMGQQATMMVAVRDAELVKKLSKMNAAVLGSDSDPFYGAPMVVVVFADKNRNTYIEDGSLVLGNMMLAAESIGVASCWIHRAKEMFESEEGKKLKEQWGVPESYAGIGNAVLGYAASDASAAKPRKEGRIIKIG